MCIHGTVQKEEYITKSLNYITNYKILQLYQAF